MEESHELFIDEIATPESKSNEILQFDATKVLTDLQKDLLARQAEDDIEDIYTVGNQIQNVKHARYLLAINPQQISALTIPLTSEVEKAANEKQLDTFTIGDWLFTCRLISPSQLHPRSQEDILTLENSIVDEPSLYFTLKKLAVLTLVAPERARIFTTEELWQRVKTDLESTVNDLQKAGQNSALTSIDWIEQIQLAFPGRIRELTFFDTWYQQLTAKLEDTKELAANSENPRVFLSTKAKFAYYLSLLTSDGLDVTEDGGLRIIPHTTTHKQSIPPQPQDFV